MSNGSRTGDGDLVAVERIADRILLVRGEKVLLDEDLAALYGVETKALNQVVGRNADRFPEDFAFRLSPEEWANLKSQSVTSSSWGGRRYPPRAFTEQGVAMLSSVLRSPRAVQVNVEIMRTFVRLRRLLASNEELAARLDDLERRTATAISQVWRTLRLLQQAEPAGRKRIGFRSDEDG